VDDAVLVLSAVKQTVRAYFIDQPRCSARKAIDVIDGSIGEDVPFCTGVSHMSLDVGCSLGPIIMRKFALQINALTDRRIGLQIDAIPQFTLPDEDERHRALSIHLAI